MLHSTHRCVGYLAPQSQGSWGLCLPTLYFQVLFFFPALAFPLLEWQPCVACFQLPIVCCVDGHSYLPSWGPESTFPPGYPTPHLLLWRLCLSRFPDGVLGRGQTRGASSTRFSTQGPEASPTAWGGGPGGLGAPGNKVGAGPDAWSRRGFLPHPARLGPWPIPGNQHGALLPVGSG